MACLQNPPVCAAMFRQSCFGDYVNMLMGVIWIFETFPNSSIASSHLTGVIPRTSAYPRMRRLHAPDCECILDVTNCSPNELLQPTTQERAVRWWIESVQWIDAAYYTNV
ncbi:unnamed protein product [Lactuca saligna]|uniref:Uncharacterized protein n=1 Tax=Lactuca saligna TaxID=75948 RepID=A0AA36DYJ3_LACSI|nr:unnamed protein product [Lactuca saligna]